MYIYNLNFGGREQCKGMQIKEVHKEKKYFLDLDFRKGKIINILY